MADHDVGDILLFEDLGDRSRALFLGPKREAAEPKEAVRLHEMPVGVGFEQGFERLREANVGTARPYVVLGGELFEHPQELVVAGADHFFDRRVRRDQLPAHHLALDRIEVGNLVSDLAVDILDAVTSKLGAHAGMHEEGVGDVDGGRQPAQPLSVDPLGPERVHALHEAERMRRFPVLADCIVEDGLGPPQGSCPLGPDRHPCLPCLLLTARRVAVDEGLEVRGGCVSQERDEVHRLVVAEQNDHLAALLRSLLLQPHQEVYALPDVRAAVGDVTGLDEGRVAAAPAQVLVDQTDLLQDRGELLKGPVNVADSHDALGYRTGRRRRRRGHAGGERDESDGHQRALSGRRPHHCALLLPGKGAGDPFRQEADQCLDDIDVVGEQIEEIIRVDRQRDGLVLGRRVDRTQAAAQDIDHAERRFLAYRSGLLRRVLQLHAAANDAVDGVRGIVHGVDPVARNEVAFARDGGDAKHLCGATVSKQRNVLEEENALDLRQV